jgi:hypothetical protein
VTSFIASTMTRLLSDNWSKAVDEPLRFFGAGFALEDLRTVRDRQLGKYLLWAAAACLLRRPSALLIFAVGYVCMGVVATSIYHAFPWHQGCVYLLWVAAYWIAYLPSYRLQKHNTPWHQIVRPQVALLELSDLNSPSNSRTNAASFPVLQP